MTPIRVVCNNTLNLALGSAKRIWSMRHTENVYERLSEARDCLGLADQYMDSLAVYADRAANTTLFDRDIKAIVEELFPITEQSSAREKMTAEKCRKEFMVCYFAPDIKRFRNTAWGVINAASDLATHSMPHRNTKNYAENNWGRVMDGHAIIDKTVKLAMAGVAA